MLIVAVVPLSTPAEGETTGSAASEKSNGARGAQFLKQNRNTEMQTQNQSETDNGLLRWLRRLVSGLFLCWEALWLIVAAPLAYAVVLCALIAAGPQAAKEWARHANIPWFR